jgi:hypothetical protein
VGTADTLNYLLLHARALPLALDLLLPLYRDSVGEPTDFHWSFTTLATREGSLLAEGQAARTVVAAKRWNSSVMSRPPSGRTVHLTMACGTWAQLNSELTAMDRQPD